MLKLKNTLCPVQKEAPFAAKDFTEFQTLALAKCGEIFFFFITLEPRVE